MRVSQASGRIRRFAIATLFVVSAVVLACAPKKLGEACKEGKGQCAAGLTCDFDVCRKCKESSGCAQDGRCAFFADRCIATPEGCKESNACKADGRCALFQGQCVRKIPQPESENDSKEGGCPCGCDHSREMVTELEGVAPEEALTATRRSLAVIGEREEAGYITEAMVEHRLRLRDLESKLSAEAEHFPPEPSMRAQPLRDAREAAEETKLDGLAVREELVVFGETLETVKGRPKQLFPCFRLWLSLENTTSDRRRVPRPEIVGDVGFDVRRWYVEGTDGEPWDGWLDPGERKSVLVIGYIDQPIQPGASVEADVELDGHAILERASALGRWDALLTAQHP